MKSAQEHNSALIARHILHIVDNINKQADRRHDITHKQISRRAVKEKQILITHNLLAW